MCTIIVYCYVSTTALADRVPLQCLVWSFCIDSFSNRLSGTHHVTEGKVFYNLIYIHFNCQTLYNTEIKYLWDVYFIFYIDIIVFCVYIDVNKCRQWAQEVLCDFHCIKLCFFRFTVADILSTLEESVDIIGIRCFI